jgi:phosphate-selective porin OprO/OprP
MLRKRLSIVISRSRRVRKAMEVERPPVVRSRRGVRVGTGLAGALLGLSLGLLVVAQEPQSAPQPLPPPEPASTQEPSATQPLAPQPDIPKPIIDVDKQGKEWHWKFKWEAWDGVSFSIHRSLEHDDPFKNVEYLDLSRVKFAGCFGGRLMLDAASLGDLPPPGGDDYELRKLSLYMRGSLVLVVPFSYKFQFDDVAGNFTTEDSWLRWDHLPYVGGLKIGQYGVPFGLENSMTSFDITMMEMSSAVTALAPGTNYGFQIGAPFAKGRMTWALGTFAPASYQATGDASGDYVRGVVRLTGLAVDRLDQIVPQYLHLGLSASELSSGRVGVQYQSRPESHLAPYLVDTGSMHDSESLQADLEAAWVKGPYSLQAEFLGSRVNRPGIPSVSFGGLYVMGTWSPTGESRPYDRSGGVLTGLVPSRPFTFKHGGRGAWELALRHSRLDLSDGEVHGGRMSTTTFGASWYMNRHAKVMMNVVHGKVEGPSPYKTINLVEFRIAINI